MEIFEKKRQIYLFLLLILAYSFLMRIPQLNFPSIGYHNTKENEYISMAKNMLSSKDFINRNVYFYNAFDKKVDFELYPQIPFVAYQIMLGYKLFGDNLWFPRLINILFMIFSLLVIFYLAYYLTKEYHLSLFSALLLSILPLGVYFSRNLQQEIGAFFFMSLGHLLFFKYIRDFSRRYLIGISLCLFMVTAYKLSFLFGFFVLVFIFPYKKYSAAKRINNILPEVMLLIIPLLILFIYWVGTGQISCLKSTQRINPFDIFTVTYWLQNGRMIWHYIINENFTLVYFALCSGGLIQVWINYKKDNSPLAKYIRAWSLTIIPYCAVFSDYINQHNYYQMPFLIFVVFACIYFIIQISNSLSNYLKTEQRVPIFVMVMIVSLLFAIKPINKIVGDQFSFILPGTDEVGKILKESMEEQDKFFLYTVAQGYAPCVYAQRKCGWVNSLEEFKNNEEKFNTKYTVIYPYSLLDTMDKDIREYLQNNYHVGIIGYSKNVCGLYPNIIVLEKGGRLNIDEFIDANKKNLKLKKIYYTVNGVVPFYIMEADKLDN